MIYTAKAAAARVIQIIENNPSWFDPFDLAIGGFPDPHEELQQLVFALGGRRNIRDIRSIAAVTQYLLLLVIVNME